MRHNFAVGILAGALTVGALMVPSVLAGQAPQVYSVAEARASDGSGPVIVLTGKALSRFRTFELLTAGGEPSGLSLTLLAKSGRTVTLAVGGDAAPGTYLLSAEEKSGAEQSFTVSLTNGMPKPGSVEGGALSTALRADLDDAETLGGNAPAYFTDAGSLSAGTLDPARFSAYADLVAEGNIGTGAAQVAAGNHDHSGQYAALTHSHSEYLTASAADATFAPIEHDHDNAYAKKALIGAKVYLSADTDQPSTLSTGLPFDQEAFDSDSCHDGATNPSRLTCRTAGYYLVVGRARYGQSGSTVQMNLLKNGSEVAEHFSIQDSHALGATVEITTVLHLQVDDYVEFSPGSGVSGNTLKSGTGKTEFMMVRVGE